MTRSHRILAAIGGLLIVGGVLLALLPKDWIEETFGFEPDAGNGLVELALVLVPVLVGAAMIVMALSFGRRHVATRASDSMLP